MKQIKFLLVFCFLSFSLIASAENYYSLKKYINPSDIPEKFYNLGGRESLVNRTYIDDDGNERDDKIYYAITGKFKSSLSAVEIKKILNPANNRLSQLFEVAIKKMNRSRNFKATMNIDTPLKTFECESDLNFSNESGDVFFYKFTDFNMVFTDLVIQIELEEHEDHTKVSLFQIAALKGMTHQKLKKFFAVEKFEKALKNNVERFQRGIGAF